MLLAVNAVRRDCRKLEGVHRLSHVAAAACRNFCGTAVLEGDFDILLLREQFSGADHGALNLLRLDGLELKNRRAAENRVVDVEIRVLGGRGNQGDAAVLYVFEQGLLLLFIEVLYLVEIEQDSVEPLKGIEPGDDLLDICGRGGGSVELLEGLAGLLCDVGREGGLSDARRPVKNQVGHVAALDDFSQRSALSEQVLLTDYIVERLRT